MLDEDGKRHVNARLRRLAGQIGGIERMVAEDRYCVDVLHQLAAVRAALHAVARMVLRSHVQTCVRDAMRKGTRREQSRKLDELVSLLSSLGPVREP